MREIGLRPNKKHPDPVHLEQWREVVKARDRVCRNCGDDRRLEVHHITYERFGRELPEDGTLVCHDCHELITGAQMKMRDLRRPSLIEDIEPAVKAERVLAVEEPKPVQMDALVVRSERIMV